MVKSLSKVLKFCSVLILVVGWVFSGWPQLWHNPSIPPKAKEVYAAPATLLLANKKRINFDYTDDNFGENLIIQTNKKVYAGLTEAEVYFSVTNIGDKFEKTNFQFYFPKDTGTVKQIAIWTKNVSYKIDVPDYKSKTFICKQGWQKKVAREFEEVLGQYQCQASKEIINCDSLSQDIKECILDKAQIGFHKETRNIDKWKNIGLSNKVLKVRQSFFDKLLGKAIPANKISNNFQVKNSTGNNGYIIQPGQTQYFKAAIQFSINSSGEFYIEAVGDKKGYGLLDPWWNSSWSYKKPITITYAGSTLTDYQVKIVTDTASLISAGKMQSDCDDIRMMNSNEGTSDSLNYWLDAGTCNTSSTVIWVKVPSISADKTIYMYYGNSLATAGDDGVNTFIFFDDFLGTSLDGTKWTATFPSGVTVNNGVTVAAGAIYTNLTVAASPQNKIFEMKAHYSGADANYSGINIANAQSTVGSNGGANALVYNMTNNGTHNLVLWGADGNTSSYNIVGGGGLGTPTLNTDYIIGYSFYGSSQLSYFYQYTSYTDINRLTYNGTWNQALYLWLGYFTGSSAGSTNIDDITVSWVRMRQYASTVPATSVGTEVDYANVFATGLGNQSSVITISSANQYVGGGFSIDSDSSRNITGITITEHGTVNAQTNLSNVKLYYDLDTIAPYNCASESYSGSESQFGLSTNFNGMDGTASFTDTVGISAIQTMCVYVVLDVSSGVTNNETLEIKINNPSTEVIVNSGTVSPTTAVEISGTTILQTAVDLQQIHYRWRNNDGYENGNDPVWWNANWLYRKKITIDHTKIDDNLTNFPVLISLSSDANLVAAARADGYDIIFTDSNSNKLDHEIEKFDEATGELVADVKVSSISNSVDTDIYVYYGNSAASDQQNKTGVWSNGFSMVYHLNELSGTSGSGSVSDATGNTSGTPSSGMSFGQSGKISSSPNFSVATGINAGSLGAPLLTASTTISFWINATNYASPGRQNPFDQAYGGWGTMTLETGGQINWYFGNNGGNGSSYIGAGSSSGLVSNSAWIYITAVRSPNGHTYKWYKNGTYLNGSTYSSSYPVIHTRTFTIGDGYVNHINGKIDEFRVASSVRSVAWIKAVYENQNSPATFYSLGNEESQGIAATFTLAEDTAMTGFTKASTTRLRLEVSNEGGQTSSGVTYRLEVSEPNPSTCASGIYERVSTNADWEMVNSIYLTDGGVTQNITSGLTDANTTFVVGQLKDTGDQLSGITLVGTTEFTEIEYSIQATANSTAGATYCFRLTNAGTVINTYTVFPQVTIFASAVISISVSDGVVTYGTMAAGTSKTTVDLSDTQTLTNNGNVTEIFNIKGQDTSCPWSLAATVGTDQYTHQFCSATDVSCSSPPTNYTALTTSYQTLYTGVVAAGIKQLDLRVSVPSVSSCFTVQTVDVTIQATQ